MSATPGSPDRMSGRLVGTKTVISPSVAVASKPRRASSSMASVDVTLVPSNPLTRSIGTRTSRRTGGSLGTTMGSSHSRTRELERLTSSAKRIIAVSMMAGSVPFEKRAAASVRSARRRLVRVVTIGSNVAASRSTVVVDPSISEVAPPMMPAMPITVSSASQITQSIPASPRPRPGTPRVRSTPSSVSIVSPLAARRTRIPAFGILARS